MQPLWRILIASALVSASTVALAQSAPTDTRQTGAALPPADSIGPPQLSNFSLGGKVTQPAQQQPVEIQPIAKPHQPAPTAETPTTASASPVATSKPSARAQSREPASEAVARASVRAEPVANLVPAPATKVLAQPQTASLTAPAALAGHSPAAAQSGWFSSLLWLLAAAAAAGAAAWYFLLQRPRTRLSPAGVPSAFEAPVPDTRHPAPAPPQAAPPAPKPTGIVATRLRPWVELQFTPGRLVLDEEKAVLEFEMTLFNSGSAPARDVLVEGALFNAGPMQDQQIGAFFQNPVGEGNRLPLLAPLQRLMITSAVALSRAQLVPLEMEGRPLLVPLAGFNALYRWGNGSEGQTSTTYLVGKQTNGEKLAPFRLDVEPRVFRRLAAREYELRVRQ